MSAPTFAAYDPADAQTQTGVGTFHGTVIVTMNGQTPGVSTGTDKLMELKVINGFIIKILRNRVAYIDR